MYNGDKTWRNISDEAATMARQLIATVNGAKNYYDEWQSFRAGRTNAQIVTDLNEAGVDETMIAELDACFAAFLTAFNALNNVAITQGDHYYAMRKFS